MKLLNVGLIGLGRVGTALGAAISHSGHAIITAHDTDMNRMDAFKAVVPNHTPPENLQKCDVVFICVPDDSIPDVARRLEKARPPQAVQVVAHTSGSMGLEVMSAVKKSGRIPAVMHPLAAFPDRSTPDPDFFQGRFFGVTAGDQAKSLLHPIIKSIGAEAIDIEDGNRVSYHLASVFASNLTVELVTIAEDLYTLAGIPLEYAHKIAVQFIENIAANLQEKPAKDALSGPIVRKDSSTIARHVEYLKNLDPELLAIYRNVSRHMLKHRYGNSADPGINTISNLLKNERHD